MVHGATSRTRTSGITIEGEGSSGESFSEGAAGNEVAAADPVVDDTALDPLDWRPLALVDEIKIAKEQIKSDMIWNSRLLALNLFS